MYYVLLYEVVKDFINKRSPYRKAHLRIVKRSIENGELLLAGAFINPPDGAALVFDADDRSIVEKFVKNDPYVKNGLISDWKIHEWTEVIGSVMCKRRS